MLSFNFATYCSSWGTT